MGREIRVGEFLALALTILTGAYLWVSEIERDIQANGAEIRALRREVSAGILPKADREMAVLKAQQGMRFTTLERDIAAIRQAIDELRKGQRAIETHLLLHEQPAPGASPFQPVR